MNADAGRSQEEIFNQTDWVLRYIAHAIGSSVLILPFSMGQVGIIPYCILLLLETYFTGHSLIYFSEIVAEEPLLKKNEHKGIDYTNYFAIIQHYLPWLDWFVRFSFIFDVIMCTAFYFKLMGSVLSSMLFRDNVPEKTGSGYVIVCFAVVTLFLLTVERDDFRVRSEKDASLKRESSSSTLLFAKCTIDKVNVNTSFPDSDSRHSRNQQANHIDMKAVVAETYSFDWKRFAMLMLFGFLMFSQFTIIRLTRNDVNFFENVNLTTQCPGMLRSSVVASFLADPVKVTYAFSSIMFALMNYAIILPICLEELTLEKHKYAELVFKAKSSLFGLYLMFPLLVNVALGASTPVLFFIAYGQTIYGLLFCVFALLMILNGMQLRVMVCIKLIEVLFGNANSKSRHWITIISIFFTSFTVAELYSELQLVVIVGSISCNLLLAIFPRLVYIKFEIKNLTRIFESFNTMFMFNVVYFTVHFLSGVCKFSLAVIGAVIHIVLLVYILFAVGVTDFNVENNCRYFFNEYFAWGT